MVRLLYYIQYPASFFTVVDNLSLWSPYSHRQYYAHWVENYGLTDRQKSLLIQYSKIREKYPWNKMEPMFMYADTMEDAWKNARSTMKNEEVEKLKEVFNAFKETFDMEWQHHGYLLRRKDDFDEIFQRCNIEQAFDEVKRFYDWEKTESEIDIHLLYNPSLRWGGGGSHAGVQLEVRPGEQKGLILQEFSVLLHEAFHIIESRNGTRQRLRESGSEWRREVLAQKEGDVCQIVTEATMGTLVPHGIIAQKYLGLPTDSLTSEKNGWEKHLLKTNKEKRMAFVRILLIDLTRSLLPITKSYLQERKTVWDNYWSKALEMYLQIRDSIDVQHHKHLKSIQSSELDDEK